MSRRKNATPTLIVWIAFVTLLEVNVTGFSLAFPCTKHHPRPHGNVVLNAHENKHDESSDLMDTSENGINRRSMLLSGLMLVGGSPWTSKGGRAEDAVPKMTHKVYMDLRVSRSDGTFYVRDDLPDAPENKVFYGRLVLGLYGNIAPQHVQQFLSFANVTYNPMDDNPLPSYGRSSFTSLDQATGLLAGGNMPSLEVTAIGGGTAMRYGGRILPAPLWVEDSQAAKISHATKGLLTHRTLDALPTFGITTRSCPELDATHVVFGQVVMDESSKDFFSLIQNIPTYSLTRPAPLEEAAVQDVAASVFNKQREFFRGAAETFGDTRLDKVYEGKLLRRVEVTKVVLL